MCAALTELEERYQQLVEYLRDASYPTCFTVNQKRGLRQKAAGFVEKGGILFHRAKVPKGDGVRLRRVIIAPAERLDSSELAMTVSTVATLAETRP